ncbi:hypothetical protein AB346_01955 [Listeria innocua]|nr:hypothetical protein [Listeria innocua]UPH63148.1 hypothetical protein AB346_01955 [Listeria innocua]
MVDLIGFDGPEPTHVIIWNAEQQSAKKNDLLFRARIKRTNHNARV